MFDHMTTKKWIAVIILLILFILLIIPGCTEKLDKLDQELKESKQQNRNTVLTDSVLNLNNSKLSANFIDLEEPASYNTNFRVWNYRTVNTTYRIFENDDNFIILNITKDSLETEIASRTLKLINQ